VEKLPTLQQPERISAWLVTTARRATWDLRRGAEHERTQQTDPAELPEGPGEENPEELVAQFQMAQRTMQALARLDERCRRLLHYLYQDSDNLTYAEIADRLELATGSIAPIRARCLERLRAQLAEEG
jgi:RNA polymerase sigma factor (sigma-70 family)